MSYPVDHFTHTVEDAAEYERMVEAGPYDDIDGPTADDMIDDAILARFMAEDEARESYDDRVAKYGEPHYLNPDNPF